MRSRDKVKFLAVLTVMNLVFTIQPIAGEWRQDEDKWRYILEDGREKRNSWLKTDDGNWYHFDENGNMRTGWYQDTDQKWYYLEPDGSMATGWKEIRGKWYYMDRDGSMASGWKEIDGKWYYLDKQSGEALVNGYTPDGYYVDSGGAWNGKSSRNSYNGSSSGSKTSNNTGRNGSNQTGGGNNQPGGGNNQPGGGNSENGNTGNNGTEGGENPWEGISPVVLEQTGIVSVHGLPYAVISFSDEAEGLEEFRYSIAGKDATSSVTPVTTSGRTVKIPLPDENTHILAITSGKWTVSVIALREPGKSTAAEKELVETNLSLPSDIPYVVLTKATIPLTQYVKFIRQGDSLFIKPLETTVDTMQLQGQEEAQSNSQEEKENDIMIEEDNRTAAGLKSFVSDAVSSATAAPPASLEGKEKTATIAVLFDLAANNIIADNLGIGTSSVEAFLSKWEPSEKLSALNEDLTLSTDAKDLKTRSWKKAEDLPRYVKYLTDKGGYGTKVELLTGKADNTNPPELTITPSLKGKSIVIQLSEENESWYRSITEIEIPYSETKTHYYQENNTLSADGKTITLGVDAISGPMNYAGDYEVTIHSFGFGEVKGSLSVVDKAPSFTSTWDDANSQLKLRAGFTYYTDQITAITVNGIRLESGSFTSDYNNLYISYRYLVNGKNMIEIQAKGYEDTSLEVESPEAFVTPKKAPSVTVREVIEGSSVVFDIGAFQEDSEEMEWFQALEADYLTLTYSYSSVSGLSLEKDGNSFTVTANKTTMSSYYTYTMKIAIPGYEAVTIAFTPVKAPPAITQQWNQENYSLMLTGNASYLSSYVTNVVLNGTERKKGEAADYTASYSKGIEIFPHNFTAGSPYRIELYASGYGITVLEGTAPADLVSPLEAPLLKSEAVVQKGTVTVEMVSGEANDWLNNISSVTISDSYSSAAVTYTKNENGLILPSVSSYSPGIYTVTIYAKGYRAAQAEVRILNSVSVKGVINYDEERLELTAADSYFYDKVTVFLNGAELKKGAGYTTSGYSTIYIPAALLTEEENLLVLYNEAYQKMEMSFGQYIAYEPAPKLEVENGTSLSGENTIVLHVADGNQEWWDSLIQSHVSVKRSSSSQTITGFSKNADEEQLSITLSGTLSYYYGYNVSISVPGYRSCNVTFTPYQKLPDITDEWLENGDLQFSTNTSYYFYSSYNTVYLDGEKLTSGTDYSLNTRTKPYNLTILAKNFTSEEHEIRILSEYNNYAPYEITVTVPENQNDMIMEARKLNMEEPVAEAVEKPEIKEGNEPAEENTEENEEEVDTGEENTEEENTKEENTKEENTKEENTEEVNTGEENTGEENTGEENPTEEGPAEESSEEKNPDKNLTEEPLAEETEPDGDQEQNGAVIEKNNWHQLPENGR
ncbi:hemoblobin-interacting domain-containing protein [Lacrimispora celerecrescens]|uniref:hemoblobin-interacting domain-containing protein n=1 Tax=Lacrimispora celerecrescens TaxID=29354 RepID=UPI0016484CA0|nr:hemoblobin-interacting domain-containing protein [Lacrimispora celerecrescens]